MQNPTITKAWKKAGTEPEAYTSPAVIHRLRAAASAGEKVERGVQFAVMPVSKGKYVLGKIEFYLHRGTFEPTRAPELIQIVAQDLSAEEALKQSYDDLNTELQIALRSGDCAPQVIKGRKVESFDQLGVLKDLSDRHGLKSTFDKLSSRWGQKTSNCLDLPQTPLNIRFDEQFDL